jgi:hypothetical protein
MVLFHVMDALFGVLPAASSVTLTGEAAGSGLTVRFNVSGGPLPQPDSSPELALAQSLLAGAGGFLRSDSSVGQIETFFAS